MKQRRLPVKRRPVKKRGFRTLFANVSRKRHRAATAAAAAELEGDVPNLGVARALLVILVIHVLAIAGIFVHSHWFEVEEEPLAVSKPVLSDQIAGQPSHDDEEVLPQMRSGDSIYPVGAGDSYASIATRFGVVEEDLRKANDNIPVRPGRYLRIPPKTITAVEPVELTAIRERERRPDPVVVETPPARPAPAPAPVEAAPERLETPGLVETEAAQRADAVLVRPQPGGNASRNNPPSRGGASYKVKPGDTFWGIAQRHGTTPEVLMKTNGISNPRHLKIGMSLTIPD